MGYLILVYLPIQKINIFMRHTYMNKKNAILLFLFILLFLAVVSINKYQKQDLVCSTENKIYNYKNLIQHDRINAMNGFIHGDYNVIIKKSVDFSFHYLLFNLLSVFTKELDKHNIKYFLIGGGLIGYFRHNHGFIPWDDDLDIGVFERDKDKIIDIINNMSKTNNKISYLSSYVDKILYDANKENPIQIDLFYYKYFPNVNNYNFAIDSHREIWKNQYIYENEIFPLKQVSYKLYLPDGKIFNEIEISIPNKSEQYLDRCYNGWKNIIKFDEAHADYYKTV